MNNMQLSYTNMSRPIISSCETFLNFDVNRVGLLQLLMVISLDF